MEEPQKKRKLSHSSSSTYGKFGTTAAAAAKQAAPPPQKLKEASIKVVKGEIDRRANEDAKKKERQAFEARKKRCSDYEP